MIIFAREDKDLALQASIRANEQAGAMGGVVRRDEHLESMPIDAEAEAVCRRGGALQRWPPSSMAMCGKQTSTRRIGN